MTFKYGDRVEETISSTGTGSSLALSGAVAGNQTFVSGIGTGNTTDYCIVDGNNWEVHLKETVTSGTPDTLSRASSLSGDSGLVASSNSGAQISLSGSARVYCDWSAYRAQRSGGLFAPIVGPAVPTRASTGLTSTANLGSATVADSASGIVISEAPHSGDNLRLLYAPAPSTPYSITALLVGFWPRIQYLKTGIGWFDGTKIQEISIVGADTTLTPSTQVPLHLTVTNWSNFSNFSSNSVVLYLYDYPYVFFKLTDDGTNVSFGFSLDGANFYTAYSIAKASGFLGASGYTNVFFGCNANDEGTGAQYFINTLMSWERG